jgi:hypothetical protein
MYLWARKRNWIKGLQSARFFLVMASVNIFNNKSNPKIRYYGTVLSDVT